jgi:polygalacturonase
MTTPPRNTLQLAASAFRTLLICCVLLQSACRCAAQQTQPPAGDADVLDVRRFGAVGDGKTLNTTAFAQAVAACAQAGGGTILVPPGRFLTGAIELQSHVCLCIDAGATLLASQRSSDYPLVEYAWAPGKHWISPLIYAHDAQDITVRGRGTIDGQGASWWAPILAAKQHRHDRGPAPADTQPATAVNPDLPDSSPGLPRGRPQIIRFLRCSDVVIEGITLFNSPEWNVHPLLCERVRIDGLTIIAHVPSPNTDGINPESCRGVQIVNCRIDNGDDCITLKSGANESGRRIGRPDEDITIANCITYHGHGGVTIGSEMSGGIRNVVVNNCVFHGTDNGIRIKSQRGRGGVVEGIVVSNVVMQDVPHPFVITTFYATKEKPGAIFSADETTPRLRNILISNVTALGATDAGNIAGLPEMPVADVTFNNVHVQAQHGLACSNASGIRFLDCVLEVKDRSALTTQRCTDIETERLVVKRVPSTSQPASAPQP